MYDRVPRTDRCTNRAPEQSNRNKGDLVVLCIDLTNVYRSISHMLIKEALERHHVPKVIWILIAEYNTNFYIRVTRSTTSHWYNLERGIITSCLISAAFFALGINMLVKSEVECWGPLVYVRHLLTTNKTYMDDLIVTISNVTNGR